MSQEKLKKAPVGTQSYWESSNQTFVKTHDNTIFDDIQSPWLPLPNIPKIFQLAFQDLDSIGSKIIAYKDPVEGDLWLEKEFSKFETSTGKKFTAAQFKQYAKFSKVAMYSFKSELTKRLIGEKIDLNAKIAHELVEVNEAKKAEMLRNGEKLPEKKILLTKEEIERLKKQVKEEFKYDESQKLTIQDVREIQTVLERVHGYLKQGENFEGEQKKVYERCKTILANILVGPYQKISLVRAEYKEAIGLMREHFGDNWGIRESYRKKLEEAFAGYISKYRKNIEADELENFQKMLGVSLYAPTKEFYSALRASELFKPINIKDYIGKTIPNPGSKYDDCTLVKYNEETEQALIRDSFGGVDAFSISPLSLQRLISQRESDTDISIPLKIRFDANFNKSLEGEFNETDIGLLETFENLANYLPKGHIISNRVFEKLRKESYFSSDNSYAHYSQNKREMFLSDKAVTSSNSACDLESGEELASVLIHETGHAVSNKLGRRVSQAYRKFVVECGWTWEQFQHVDEKREIDKSNNYIATGDDPDIKRFGSKSDVPLITDYAGKSPEEAFAEYYSFYTQHKKAIDEYLRTNNPSPLNKQSTLATVNTDRRFDSFRKHLHTPESDRVKQEIDAILLDSNRNTSDHIRVGVLDPYYDNLENLSEKDVNPSQIAYEKKFTDNKRTPQPVFTVFNYHSGKHSIVGGDEGVDQHIHYANKYLRRLSPTFSISKECYNILHEKGYTYQQIRNYALEKVGDQKVPKVKDTNVVNGRVQGLRYRGAVISTDKLVKMKGIFQSMKNIWESEDLKKALAELGLLEYETDINKMEDQITKAKITDLFELFANAKEEIVSALKSGKRREQTSKKKYADCIIRDSQGKLLLLQRSYQDDFMPGKWCLPGGKIEPNEDPLTAATRELEEETGLNMIGRLTFIKTVQKEDCTISYYEGVLNAPAAMVLDNNEHYNCKFIDMCELESYDLILDLGQFLKTVTLSILNVSEEDELTSYYQGDINKLFARRSEVEDLFNDDKIGVEEYQAEMLKLKKASFFFIKKAFDNGDVDEASYYKAYQAYQKLVS